MLKVSRNRKLCVKLQASFVLVMLSFAAAIVGMLFVNAKVAAVNAAIDDQLHPSSVAILRTEFLVRSAAVNLGRHTLERDPSSAATLLADFRQNVTDFDSEVDTATKLAADETQRAALAEFRERAAAWKRRNAATLALRESGRYADAERVFLANPIAPLIDAAEKYRNDIRAMVESRTNEAIRLTTLAKTLGIGLLVGALILGVRNWQVPLEGVRSGKATTRAIGDRGSENVGALTHS